jgi:hypothetical protein
VLLIAITGLILACFVRISVHESLATIRRSRATRTRWAVASCQRVVFRNIDRLLGDNYSGEPDEELQLRPLARIGATLVLNHERLSLVIADESAKLDINLVFQASDETTVRQAICELGDCDSASVQLRPLPAELARSPREQSFESWDQVFLHSDGQPWSPIELVSTTGELTCWSRQLCWRTASDEVLLETTEALVGPVIANRIADFRKNNPDADVKTMLSGLPLNSRQKETLQQAITDSGKSHSMWIQVAAGAGQPGRFWLTIREEFGPGLMRFNTFVW